MAVSLKYVISTHYFIINIMRNSWLFSIEPHCFCHGTSLMIWHLIILTLVYVMTWYRQNISDCTALPWAPGIGRVSWIATSCYNGQRDVCVTKPMSTIIRDSVRNRWDSFRGFIPISLSQVLHHETVLQAYPADQPFVDPDPPASLSHICIISRHVAYINKSWSNVMFRTGDHCICETNT